MPRQPALPHEDLQEAILCDAEDILDKKGLIAGPSALVWEKISDRVGRKVSSKYAYTFVQGNRYGTYDKLLEYLQISVSHRRDVPSSSSVESDSEDIDDPAGSDSPAEKTLKPQCNFNVIIPPMDWATMKPVRKTYERKDRASKRTISAMPPFTYEAVLTRLLWEQHKIPCPYRYRHAYVSTAEQRDQFVRFDAECRECGATARGRIISEPIEDEPVMLIWRANDTRGLRHRRRRQLRNEERNVVGRHLQHDSCARYRRDLAARSVDHGDPEPPNLWSDEVLRQTKVEKLDANLGVVRGTDAVRNLQIMKHQEPFAGTIHDIGVDKFYVHYHTPSQKELYRQYRKTSYVSLCIDATGSLVQRLPRPHGTSGHIFLYEGVIHTGNFQLSVMQMLSEKNDANSILYWLNEWERGGCRAPQEVVVDNSAALKAAVARSFCRCSDFQDLRNKCFEYLKGESALLPPCYLRIDVAHLMNSARRWKAWKDCATRRSLKQFYLHCLGVLIQATSLENFRVILRHIFIVALSPNEGRDEDGTAVPMESSLKYLMQAVKGHVTSEDNGDKSEEEENNCELFLPEEDDALVEEASGGIHRWLDALWTEVECAIEYFQGDRLNPYYSVKIAQEFRRVSLDFPFWSSVLVDAYRSPFLTPSSAPVESDFKDLKQIALKNMKPLRADKLVAHHFRSLEGMCRLARAKSRDAPTVTRAGEKRVAARLPKIEHELDKRTDGVTKFESETDRQSTTALNTNDGSVKGRSDADALDFKTESEESDCVEALCDLNTTENWRGVGEPTSGKRPTKQTKLDANPELDAAVLSREAGAVPKHRILQNGNWCKPISLSAGSTVLVLNTCPFDSLCQVFAAAYIDNDRFRQIISASNNLLLNTSRKLAVHGAVPDTYRSRVEALVQVLEPSSIHSETVRPTRLANRNSFVSVKYDCFSNAPTLASSLLKDSRSATVRMKCSSEQCLEESERAIVIVDVNVHSMFEKGVGALQDAVNDALVGSKKKKSFVCASCGSDTTREICIAPHLIVNTDFIADDQLQHISKGSNNNRPHTLDEIPTTLCLSYGRRDLVGIVAYTRGHYVAFTKRRNGGWEINDDLAKDVVRVGGDTLMKPHLLVYTL